MKPVIPVLYAIEELQYQPWKKIASLVTSGNLCKSQKNYVLSGAESLSKHKLGSLSDFFQQKCVDLHS